MKIYKMPADIYLYMPSFVLRLTGLLVVVAIVAAACICPAAMPPADDYRVIVKLASGLIAAGGSICLATAIGRTFLRSGGTGAFKAAYVAALSMAGPGLAEALSAFRPVDIGSALLTCCIVWVISGALWGRFYGRAA